MIWTWLKRLFHAEPPPLKGKVIAKQHQPYQAMELRMMVGNVPMYDMGHPEEWYIIYGDGKRSRRVCVTKECFDKYEVGDDIEFAD